MHNNNHRTYISKIVVTSIKLVTSFAQNEAKLLLRILKYVVKIRHVYKLSLEHSLPPFLNFGAHFKRQITTKTLPCLVFS